MVSSVVVNRATRVFIAVPSSRFTLRKHSNSPATSGELTFARVVSVVGAERIGHGRVLIVARRKCAAAVLISVRIVRAAGEVRVGDAGEIASRRRREALRIGVEYAIAEAWIFVALQAERVPAADGLSRRDARQEETATRQSRHNETTHHKSPRTILSQS